jgi:hypothetical protein
MVKKIGLVAVGVPPGERILICDEDGLYWTGGDWIPDLAKARRYHDPVDVAADYRVMEEALVAHLPVWEFRATAVVRVRGHEPFRPEELVEYLLRAVTIQSDHDRCGAGPTPGTVVQINIDWGGLVGMARPRRV